MRADTSSYTTPYAGSIGDVRADASPNDKSDTRSDHSRADASPEPPVPCQLRFVVQRLPVRFKLR